MNYNNIIPEILKVLKEHEDQLNSINVFPIADKDTGTNLYKTLDVQIDADNFKDFIFQLSDKVLYSARGSSGNILALFLLGLKENYSEDIENMCKKAAEFAWNTMYEPRQGTILTAIATVPHNYASYAPEHFIYDYYQNVLDCLMQGPDLLPILKECNTIDSGTLGFAYILQGFYTAIAGDDGFPFELEITLPTDTTIKPEEKRYCVELLLEYGCADKLGFLKDYGDELIILKTDDMTKLHIHTDDDFTVVKKVEEVSRIVRTKIDDMKSGEHWEVIHNLI